MKSNPLAALCALLLTLLGGLVNTTKAGIAVPTPYYDVVGNICISEEVTQATLALWKPFTFDLTVPPDSQTDGFHVGFGILPSLDEHGVILQSVMITDMKFSLYHYDALTGLETPVMLPNGQPATNISPALYHVLEAGTSKPCVFTLDGNNFNGNMNSPGNVAIKNTPVANVGTICSTRQRFQWNQFPDLTRPTLNKGYVLHWSVTFIPMYAGITLPAVTKTAQFMYLAQDVPLPNFVSLTENGPNGGTLLRYQGSQLEFFELCRSTDLVNWTPWPFAGEGNDYIGSGIFQWELFDREFPEERRVAPREFYQLKWKGRRGFWRTGSFKKL